MTEYFDRLCEAMVLISKEPESIFVGQTMEYPGTAMHNTFRDVPQNQKLEFPVAENFQLGFCIGLAFNGYLPVCCYPRINFLMCAMDQLVLHLDKIPKFSISQPKVIIRTAIASRAPLDPGPQHLGDLVPGLRQMLDTVYVERLPEPEDILPAYQAALERPGSTLLVELLGRY